MSGQDKRPSPEECEALRCRLAELRVGERSMAKRLRALLEQLVALDELVGIATERHRLIMEEIGRIEIELGDKARPSPKV